MKSRSMLSAIITGAFGLCIATTANAQDALLHITDPVNKSLDYIAPTDDYLLSGRVSPTTIAGMSNASPFGFLPRIQLQVVNNGTMSTSLYATYCTAAEVMAVQDMSCTSLSTGFYQSDAKRTSDGGYILCGYVVRDFEYTSCPGPTYCNPYLLKTDAAGNVMWFRKYNSGYDNRTRFYSVVEDPATNRYIVCGETTPGLGILPTAFVMGTDAAGVMAWARAVTTHKYGDPSTTQTSTYTEITPYTDKQGRKYFALTGTVGYGSYFGYGINTGGGLLTVLDGNGLLVRNYYLSEDGYGRFMQLKGINDAKDGDVVLTGFSGANTCGAHDGFNLLIMKMNPMTNSMSFMKVYQTNPSYMYDISYGNSITVNNDPANGVISVVGYQNSGVYGSSDYGIYVETDYNGSLLRYTPHSYLNAVSGEAVVYNSTNGYTGYSGPYPTGTFLTKDNFGYACDGDEPAFEADLDYDTVRNIFSAPSVITMSEPLMMFPLPVNENIACGYAKPGRTASAAEVVAGGKLTISPNPAEKYIDVQLSNTKGSSTVKVYDMTGRQVLAQETGASGAVRLNVADLANGVYMLTAGNGGATEHATFVKQ